MDPHRRYGFSPSSVPGIPNVLCSLAEYITRAENPATVGLQYWTALVSWRKNPALFLKISNVASSVGSGLSAGVECPGDPMMGIMSATYPPRMGLTLVLVTYFMGVSQFPKVIVPQF